MILVICYTIQGTGLPTGQNEFRHNVAPKVSPLLECVIVGIKVGQAAALELNTEGGSYAPNEPTRNRGLSTLANCNTAVSQVLPHT